MDKKEIKELLKKEIAPLLIGIRNDLEDNKKATLELSEEVKKKSNLEYELEVDDQDYKGLDGYNPVPDKDYPSEQTVFNFIKDNLPKRGKDYFNEKDIKDIIQDVFVLMPTKEELKGKDGVIDYSTVEKLALPLIEKKYKAFKKDLDVITNKVFKAIEEGKIPELTASQIRNKLEGLTGNDRLSAKAIKGLEKFVGVVIAQSGGGGGFIPTLQQVTEKGATTDKTITVAGVTYNTNYTPTGTEPVGTRYWNSVKGTTSLKRSADSTLDDGKELGYYVKARGAISNGDLVQFAGYQGDHYTAKVCVPAEVIAFPRLIMGIATEDIANGEFGNITAFGEVTMNTTGWLVDDKLWFDNATGQLTNVEPNAPEKNVLVGVVTKEETSPAAANGKVLTRITWGLSLDELDDVDGSAPTTTGDLLSYDQPTGTWERNAYNINDYLSKTQFADIKRQGVVDRAETTFSFNGTNTFTLTPTGTTWSYYRAGLKYTITGAKTVVIPGSPIASGIWFIYIDDTIGTLTASQTPWTLQDTKVPIATINFNNSLTPKFWTSDERHSSLIDGYMQYYLHNVDGARSLTTPSLTGYTVNTDTNVAKTFAISACTLVDQDIVHSLASLPDPNGTATDYVVWYRTGPSTWAWKLSNMPFLYNTATDWIQYDNNGTPTDLTGGAGALTRWTNSYLLLTNKSGASRFAIIAGRGVFTSLESAKAESISTFTWDGFPIAESVIVYQLTWSTVTSTSQGKCRLASEPTLVNISTVTNNSSGAGTDHNTLSNLQGGTLGQYYHLTSAENSGNWGAKTLTATQFNTANFRIREMTSTSIAIGDADTGLNSTKDNSIFIGKGAGTSVTGGFGENVFIGKQAGSNATNGSNNVYIGASAGSGATNASGSLFIGASAGAGGTSASNAVFFGVSAGQNATGASNSVFIGNSAGRTAPSASGSLFIGGTAGQEATSAFGSIVIGNGAGAGARNAETSTFIGTSSGAGSVNASKSICIGYNAGAYATNAKNSIFIGYNAGLYASVDNTGGNPVDDNKTSIAIGHSATPRAFTKSIAIGYSAGNTANRQLNIGNVFWIDGISDTTFGTSSVDNPDILTTAQGRINGSWNINKGHYTSLLFQSGTSIVDKVTEASITVDTNTTYSIEFDIISTKSSGIVDVVKVYGVVQNVAGVVMPVGKLRAMTDTGITSYEWFVGGTGGNLISASNTWAEDGTITLKFDIVTNKIQITSSESITGNCGSVRITKTPVSSGYYY